MGSAVPDLKGDGTYLSQRPSFTFSWLVSAQL